MKENIGLYLIPQNAVEVTESIVLNCMRNFGLVDIIDLMQFIALSNATLKKYSKD